MKYPLEIVSVVRTQTLYFEASFGRAKSEENEAPLHIYNKFSRFKGCLINDKKVAATCNIPIDEIPGIVARSNYAFQSDINNTPMEDNDPAYSVKFTSGNLKGKSPAEVLIHSEDGEKLLNEQYKFLKENLAKFPNNQKIMDAIKDAAEKKKSGTLKEVNKTSTIPLYVAEMRPLMTRTREDGMTFTYKVEIDWNIGMTYPVEVKISNYYAPVKKNEKTGMINVLYDQRDKSSEVNNSMKLTASEWMDILYKFQMSMRTFEQLNALKVWEDALNADKSNREEYKKKEMAHVYKEQ